MTKMQFSEWNLALEWDGTERKIWKDFSFFLVNKTSNCFFLFLLKIKLLWTNKIANGIWRSIETESRRKFERISHFFLRMKYRVVFFIFFWKSNCCKQIMEDRRNQHTQCSESLSFVRNDRYIKRGVLLSMAWPFCCWCILSSDLVSQCIVLVHFRIKKLVSL